LNPSDSIESRSQWKTLLFWLQISPWSEIWSWLQVETDWCICFWQSWT
jgi:hypothetical protein